MMRWLGSLAVLAGALLFTSGAAASTSFPDEVKAHLTLSSSPPCSLCHEGGVTGYGTVTTPFGKSLRTHGAVAQNLGSLDAALDQMAAQKTDSDGDGIPDIVELKNGTDPNRAGGVAPAKQPDLAYGCAPATIAPSSPGRTGVFLGIAGVVAAIAWARRRRSWRGAAAASTAALILVGCYQVSFVSTDVCESGLEWTGGNHGSPDMRPGAACEDCHARGGPRFTFSGTVFGANEPDDCMGASGAAILITGADGKSIEMKTNEAGNFYTNLKVQAPYRAAVIAGGKTKVMVAQQTIGDCNICHTQTGTKNAPGRITLP